MTAYHETEAGVLYLGDCLEVLRGLPAGSVQCCVTSPPYWGLRDYGCDGQLGLEPTPAEYVAGMVAVFEEVRRVLREDGCLWLNLGDSYASSGTFASREEMAATRGSLLTGGNLPAAGRAPTPPGLKPKDLVGIPWRVAFALQEAGWWLRSDVIWAKPNPMPESVTDRPTRAHEYIFLLTKNARYYYDADAVREGAATGHDYRATKTFGKSGNGDRNDGGRALMDGDGGRNLRTVWSIPTQPTPFAHFATFPLAIPDRCIRAGTSERGCCPECGAPWERVVERGETDWEARKAAGAVGGTVTQGHNTTHGYKMSHDLGKTASRTTGWRPTCSCPEADPIPCTVLDPFFGSGTTGIAASRLGRRYVGIELNQEYADLAASRVTAPWQRAPVEPDPEDQTRLPLEAPREKAAQGVLL